MFPFSSAKPTMPAPSTSENLRAKGSEPICPITQEPVDNLQHPYLASDGVVYERDALHEWLQACDAKGMVLKSPLGKSGFLYEDLNALRSDKILASQKTADRRPVLSSLAVSVAKLPLAVASALHQDFTTLRTQGRAVDQAAVALQLSASVMAGHLMPAGTQVSVMVGLATHAVTTGLRMGMLQSPLLLQMDAETGAMADTLFMGIFSDFASVGVLFGAKDMPPLALTVGKLATAIVAGKQASLTSGLSAYLAAQVISPIACALFAETFMPKLSSER